MNNPVMTSTSVVRSVSTATTTSTGSASSTVTSTAQEESNAMTDKPDGVALPATAISSSQGNVAQSDEQPGLVTPSPTPPISLTNAAVTPSQNNSTASAIVSSTRSRFEKLEKKIKSSLGGLNQVNIKK